MGKKMFTKKKILPVSISIPMTYSARILDYAENMKNADMMEKTERESTKKIVGNAGDLERHSFYVVPVCFSYAAA